jgi:hypothetical protein
MSLPWFRLDSHIGSHDKVLLLFSDPSPKRWQAFSSYVCAMGWSVDHGTDGDIIPAALPFVHGTTVTARLLVKYRMWEESANGWSIVNFAERQQLDVITAGKQAARRAASEKANCTRHHAPGCWTGTHCPILSGSDSESDLRIGAPTYEQDVPTDGDVGNGRLSGSLPERVRAPRRDSRRRVG